MTLNSEGWHWEGPGGAPEHKAFLYSAFLWLQEIAFIQPPWPSLSSNGQIQAAAHWRRERIWDQGETVKSSLGASSLFPTNVNTQHLWPILQILNPPPRWETLMIKMACCHKQVDPRAAGPEGWWCCLLLTHHQPIRRMSTSWSCPLWTITIKTSHYPLQVGTHISFDAGVHCVPLCLVK